MMYGLAALTVGISSIPLLFILWRVLKAPIHPHSGLALKISGVGAAGYFMTDNHAHQV